MQASAQIRLASKHPKKFRFLSVTFHEPCIRSGKMDETIEIKQMKKVFPDNPFIFDLFFETFTSTYEF